MTRNDPARLNPRPFPGDTPETCAQRMIGSYGVDLAWQVATSKKTEYDHYHLAALKEGDDPKAWRGYADFWHSTVIAIEQTEEFTA